MARGIFEKVQGSGIWFVRYADATARIRKEKAGTKTMARFLYQKRKAEALQGRKLPEKMRRRNIPMSELVADALTYSKGHKRSYPDDVCRFRRIQEWFGDLPAETMTPQRIDSQLSKVGVAEHLAATTLNRYRSLLSLAFRLGMESGKVQANPARLVRRRLEDNTRVRFLTESEEARLRAAIREHGPEREPELDIALQTGLRRGGMYKLEWCDVDFEHRILAERFGKQGKTRYVPLNPVAIEAFRKLRQASTGEGRVFDIQKPRHWFEKAVALAGIEDFTWHDLRHTFGSPARHDGRSARSHQEAHGPRLDYGDNPVRAPCPKLRGRRREPSGHLWAEKWQGKGQ